MVYEDVQKQLPEFVWSAAGLTLALRVIPGQTAAAKLFALYPDKTGLTFIASPAEGPWSCSRQPSQSMELGNSLTRGQIKPRNTEKKLCKCGSLEPYCTKMEAAMGTGVTDQVQIVVFYTANYSDSNKVSQNWALFQHFITETVDSTEIFQAGGWQKKKIQLETEFYVTKACGQRRFQKFNVFLEGN